MNCPHSKTVVPSEFVGEYDRKINTISFNQNRYTL